jgi:hypothetical protein
VVEERGLRKCAQLLWFLRRAPEPRLAGPTQGHGDALGIGEPPLSSPRTDSPQALVRETRYQAAAPGSGRGASGVGPEVPLSRQLALYTHAGAVRVPRYTLKGPAASAQEMTALGPLFVTASEAFTSWTTTGVNVHAPPAQASVVHRSASLHREDPPSSTIPSQSSSSPLQPSVPPGWADAWMSSQSVSFVT